MASIGDAHMSDSVVSEHDGVEGVELEASDGSLTDDGHLECEKCPETALAPPGASDGYSSSRAQRLRCKWRCAHCPIERALARPIERDHQTS